MERDPLTRDLAKEVPSPACVELSLRKKLLVHFEESDKQRLLAIGGAYVTNSTMLANVKGKPIKDLSKTDG